MQEEQSSERRLRAVPDGNHEIGINVKQYPSLNVKRTTQADGSATPPFRAAKCFRITPTIS